MLSTQPSTTRSALPESIECDRAASYRRPAAIERAPHHPGSDHPKEEEGEMHHGLLKQLFARFNPSQWRPEIRKWWCPTDGDRDAPPRFRLFRIELFAKKSRVSWLSEEHSRFYLEPEPPEAIPIPLARLVVDGPTKLRLEQDGDGSRPGALSCMPIRLTPREPETALPAAVIRRLPGSRGTLVLTCCVTRLAVRLHDKLFLLPFPSSSVTLTFSGRWFYISHRWAEEPLYSPVDIDYIDITSTLEKLIQVLYQMYREDQGEKGIKQVQEKRQPQVLFRKREDLEAVCWESHRFELSLDTDRRVQCNFVEQEYPSELHQRVICDGRFVLPLTTSSLDLVGFVEGYSDPGTVCFTEQRDDTEKLRRVVLASTAPRLQGGHVLTFKFLADHLKIRLDDGIVLRGWNGVSVDIRCESDDAFSSKLLLDNHSSRILEWEAHDESPIPCASLLAQLSRKPWKLHECVTEEEENELGLEAMFELETEEDTWKLNKCVTVEEENELGLEAMFKVETEEDKEAEQDSEFSLLFGPPEEHDWVNVSEPYVPKFPTEEEIRERKERRKEQLKQVMAPITLPVSEPARGRNYFMDQPGTAVTRDARPPDCGAFFNNWTLSDKSESMLEPKSNVYPTLACLEWCNCTPCPMLQFYTLELIVDDSHNSCKLDVSGFVAIRDFEDGLRNYIFNREMTDPLTTVSHNGVLLLPTLSPRRAISPTILLEFDLKMKRTGDGINYYQQLIQGVSELPGGGPSWSRVNMLSIRTVDSHSIPMMRVKLAMIMDGVEATVELRPLTLPSQGIDLRCVARTGCIGDDIVLFNGRYGGDDRLLQFVVATELRDSMEIHLEGVYGGVIKRWSIGFEPKFHAVFSEAVDLSFAQVSLSVSWSESCIYRTDGPPDL